MNPKRANLKLVLDGIGKGTIVLNGIHIGHLVQRTVLISDAVDGITSVRIDLLVDTVELEGTDTAVLLNELRPEVSGPLQHVPFLPKVLGPAICSVCRQVVGSPKYNPDECPGEPDWWRKEKARHAARLSVEHPKS